MHRGCWVGVNRRQNASSKQQDARNDGKGSLAGRWTGAQSSDGCTMGDRSKMTAEQGF